MNKTWFKYVKIPFVNKGRDFSGCDCWGLVRLIYLHELGIELPEYGEISAADIKAIAYEMGNKHGVDPWCCVESPRVFDVCVMKFHGKSWIGHVGVMMNNNTLIHTEKVCGTVIVNVSHFTIKNRIVGYRRHKLAP